jgi:hypothetical protein
MVFVFMLILPTLLSLTHVNGMLSKTGRNPAPPGFDVKVMLEPEYYQAWTHFANAGFTSDPRLTHIKNWLDYRLFAMTDAKEVHVGKKGWLFDKRSIQDFRKTGCQKQAALQQLITDLRAMAHLSLASGRRFIMTVVPNKSTIYPEHVGAVPREKDCGQSLYDLFLAEHARQPIKGFVRLDVILSAAKNDQPVYAPSSTHWNHHGADLAAQALLKVINPNGLQPASAEDDLSRFIMNPQKTPPSEGHARPKTDQSKRQSAALIYGGPALKLILPQIMPRFERLDVIAATTLPSLNLKEDIVNYETIIVVVTESRLLDLNLKINQVCKTLEADISATTQREIKLESLTARHGAALNLENGHLSVKSMGSVAFIELPKLPGSDTLASRLLKLDVIAPHNDTFTWSFDDGRAPGGTRKLRPGRQTLYLPLPQKPWIQMLINTGRLAGIFKFQEVVLLTFGRDDKEVTIASQPPPAEPSVAMKKSEPQPPPPDPAASLPPSIVLNDFQSKRIFQRRGQVSDVFISGSFRGHPTAIEAQVLHYRSNTVVVPWTVVDSTPSNGIFMGIITGVPQGGWYRLAVRFQNRPKIFHRGRSRWGVGILVACIGQSNMKEWFFTGGNGKTNDLLSVHRNGRWISTEGVGRGAAAFGHRIIDRLSLPVGLLDYAVNGSGLRREADWGEGYWADRSENSIYQKFVRGVTAAGGAVEYVVWMQGEADAARKTITESQYSHTLKTFINQQVRKDIVSGYDGTRLPFLIVGMAKRPIGKDEPHQAIRNALVAATQNIPDCYLAATTLDLENLGRQHLTAEAYGELGLRVAQTVLHLLGKSNYYRGPSLHGIRRVTPTIIDIDLHHRGGSDFAPLFDITGFEVRHQDTPLAIAQVQRHNPRTIRIHLAGPAPGPLTIRYLYGAMPDSSGAVRDNSKLRLPLEPFVGGVE